MKSLRYVICPRTFSWLKNSTRVLCSLVFFAAIAVSVAQAEKKWYPVEVEEWNPPFLVEAALNRYAADIDFIAGNAVTAEAAVKILRERRLADRINILSYYYSPGVHRGIRRGGITAAPSDLTVLQARLAVDVMVRILEKKDYYKHIAPRVTVVDRDNIRSWDTSTTLAPRGVRPIFSINE
jgi:hypothetical protein